MPFISVDGFLEELRKNRLLKPAQIDEASRILQSRFSAPLGLAKEFVRRGWLTVYQVNQLFQANGQELVLGPYRILDYLGKGGVSQVFKAFHQDRNCLVAVKVIHPHLLMNAEAVGRFEREKRAVASLSHPNIVQSFDDASLGDTHFFAMEFVEGTDLGKMVQLSGPLPVAEACDAIRQAANGLAHAHEKGLVHRDIKPQNLVLIAGSTLIKILDLGLARLLGSTAPGAALTVQGSLIGTPDYISPEQARDPRSVDARADIYSLGCTLYYLLTGQPPFPDPSLMKKMYMHIHTEPAPVTTLRPEIPEPLAAVLRKMMAKKPDDRYVSGDEVAAAMAPYCAK